MIRYLIIASDTSTSTIVVNQWIDHAINNHAKHNKLGAKILDEDVVFRVITSVESVKAIKFQPKDIVLLCLAGSNCNRTAYEHFNVANVEKIVEIFKHLEEQDILIEPTVVYV